MAKHLDLFEYSDYRLYLKSWLKIAKEEQRSNLSRLAEKIGVHPTFLAHVLSGSKNLSFEQCMEISAALGHTQIEEDYFLVLLHLDRAGSMKLRAYWTAKKKAIEANRNKLDSRVGEHHELTDEHRAIFYSNWLYVAIFVATAIEDGRTLEQIAQLFALSRSKAEEILNFLTLTGICMKEGSIFKMGKTVVYIPNESPFVTKHHTNWRLQACHKMDSREETELFFTSPMSISKKDFQKIRNIIALTIEQSLEICKASPAEEVVCLNIDFFKPVTR